MKQLKEGNSKILWSFTSQRELTFGGYCEWCCWTSVYRFLCGHMFSSLRRYKPRNGTTGSSTAPGLASKLPDCFPKWLHHFTLLNHLDAVLWSECTCSPQNHMLKSNPPKGDSAKKVGPLGGGCYKAEALLNEVSVLTKKQPESSWPLPPHEDTARRPGHELGKGPSPDQAAPWFWSVQPPELWELNLCCLEATQSVVFCYSSPNRLGQVGI